MTETEKSSSPTPDARPSPSPSYMVRSRPTFASQGVSFTGSEIAEMKKDFEDLADFAGGSLIYSGFIVALVIAFLTLANKVAQNTGSIEVEAGMTLCFLATSCHLSIILVSSRACVVAYQYSQILKSNSPSRVEEYRIKLEASLRTLRVCEWIQGFGQTLIVPSLLYMIWLMFEHHVLVLLIYGFIVLLDIAIYFAGFWRVSWGTTTLLPLEKYLRRRRRRTGVAVA